MALMRGPFSESLTALLVFLGAMALYLFTLAPTITQRHFGADGAELTAAAYTLGVAHPSGYPTYLLLAKAFTLVVPWGEVAYRVNVLSAFSGAGAVVLVYFMCRLFIGKAFRGAENSSIGATAAATVAAASFAVSPLFWSQSVIAEVYSLNALFMGGVMFLALRWWRDPGAGFWPLLTAAFLLGLGLGNHLTLVFVTLPLGYVMEVRSGELTPGALAKLLGAFILGLFVYAYLPIRASGNPAINWGDATSLEGFLWTVSAAPYRGLAFSVPLADMPERLAEWAAIMVRQFNVLGLFMGILGVWRLRVSGLPLLVFTALLFLLTLTFSVTYPASGAQVYLIPAFMVFAIWIGVGVYWLGNLVLEAGGLRLRWSVPLLLALFLAALLVLPGLNLLRNYGGVSLRGDDESLIYAQGVFQGVEPDAVILADTDYELFSLWYYSLVKKGGRGPTVVSTRLTQFEWYLRGQSKRYPEVVPAGVTGAYDSRLIQIVEFNLGVRPVYITTGANALLAHFEGKEEGTLYRLLSRKG
ncbi:MAG: DUF2723 domain-containing protein [Chloroflexi bacterium]|nr:DUF2723 domain-containing protein [Chloroflexota bacterium]